MLFRGSRLSSVRFLERTWINREDGPIVVHKHKENDSRVLNYNSEQRILVFSIKFLYILLLLIGAFDSFFHSVSMVI